MLCYITLGLLSGLELDLELLCKRFQETHAMQDRRCDHPKVTNQTNYRRIETLSAHIDPSMLICHFVNFLRTVPMLSLMVWGYLTMKSYAHIN